MNWPRVGKDMECSRTIPSSKKDATIECGCSAFDFRRASLLMVCRVWAIFVPGYGTGKPAPLRAARSNYR